MQQRRTAFFTFSSRMRGVDARADAADEKLRPYRMPHIAFRH